jgi:hypothetical protein
MKSVRSVVTALLSLSVIAFLACGGDRPERTFTASDMDAFLVELGGEYAGELDRGTRWRMISSIGGGLPPADFGPENLPEPESRNALLLQAYCVQCHSLPTPRMHAADEWPILMRRMLMRVQTLENRMGGPLTEEIAGEMALEGAKVTILPSPAELDTLLTYLQDNALPVVDPAELGTGPEVGLYVRKCSICHDTPDPAAIRSADADAFLARMQANMVVSDVTPLTPDEFRRVFAFIEERGAM